MMPLPLPRLGRHKGGAAGGGGGAGRGKLTRHQGMRTPPVLILHIQESTLGWTTDAALGAAAPAASRGTERCNDNERVSSARQCRSCAW